MTRNPLLKRLVFSGLALAVAIITVAAMTPTADAHSKRNKHRHNRITNNRPVLYRANQRCNDRRVGYNRYNRRNNRYNRYNNRRAYNRYQVQGRYIPSAYRRPVVNTRRYAGVNGFF